MAAKHTTSTPNAPKTTTLTGKSFQCYRAGNNMGSHAAYADSATNLRRYKEHLEHQLAELRAGLLKHPEHPITEDHPLYAAVTALPTLAAGIESIAAQFDARASQHQSTGTALMGRVVRMEEARAARWQPPWRAFFMLLGVVATSSIFATLAAVYATRVGW